MFGLYVDNRTNVRYNILNKFSGGGTVNRIILHCDLNNFYASVECVKNPELKNRAVAVCGNENDRHGIVLAKSQRAKEFGVKTGDTVAEARKKCGDIVIVHPDFDSYFKYSKAVRKIYERYTDLIEPFGIDECWLDVTGSRLLFGNGESIAEEIRNAVKNETGLTISVGVSFNKVFAKLGSDMKKPDAVTVISEDNFREKVWRLSANEMLWVGRQTYKTLLKYGIATIGDIASSHPSFMRKLLGKNGFDLWLYANGRDCSPVSHKDERIIPQSVGRGTTCVESLVNEEEVTRVITELSENVSKALRREGLLATGLSLTVKNDALSVEQYSSSLSFPTHSVKELSEEACRLFHKRHVWKNNIRAVTVTAAKLVFEDSVCQLSIGYDIDSHDKTEDIEDAVNDIKSSYGRNTVFCASRLFGTKIPSGKPEKAVLPTVVL